MEQLGQSGKALLPALGGAGFLFGGTFIANNCLYDVEAGHRAVKFNRITGLGNTVIAEGTHVVIPWFEWPIIFDVRSRPRKIRSFTGTKDLQMVDVSIRTLVRPDESALPTIYRTLGTDYDEKVLPSIINEILKSVVAQFNAAQLIQEREKVSKMIQTELIKRASEFNILLDDVALTELSFSPEYERAVEQKQVALQQVEKAKFHVLKAVEEKKMSIIKAEGEKEAASLIGKAIADNPGFVDLRRIDVAREIAVHIARSSNKLLLNSGALMLNLVGDDKKRERALH